MRAGKRLVSGALSAVFALSLLGSVPAGAGVMSGYEQLYREIGDIVEKNFYDARFVAEKFEAIRERYAAKAAKARSRAQFAEVVNTMLAELKSSHTRYYTPDDTAYYQLLSIFKGHPGLRSITQGKPVLYPSIGIETERRKDRTFVTAVYEGGPAEKAGILKGDEVLSLDGLPFEQAASLREKVGQNAALSVRRKKGAAPLAITLSPVMADPREEFLAAERASVRLVEAGTKKIGYIHLLSYAGQEFQDAFLDAVSGPLREADALVLDLRDGWGGADPQYLNAFNRNVPVLSMIGRDGAASVYDPQWRKPVALLVNGRVRSGKEILAAGFRKYGIGAVIGERTAGAVLGGSPFPLSDGSVLYLAVTGIRVDGEVVEGRGVEPDVPVPMDVEYLEGNDTQLRKALEYLSAAPEEQQLRKAQ